MSLAAPALDFDAYVEDVAQGRHSLHLLVEGMRCVSCAFSIEAALNAEPDVKARINVTAKRLDLSWEGPRDRGNALAGQVTELGFSLRPWRAESLGRSDAAEEQELFRAMAVAGFGSANIMLLSFVLWFAGPQALGPATRDMFHWLSALIALPCVVYAGQPFFRSAWLMLRAGHTNMDVPISLAIVLASGVSLFETIGHGAHAYFDSAVMLLFVLLIGRWLDRRARGRARSAAQDLLMLMNGAADVIDDDGRMRCLPIEQIREGMRLQVAAGARIGADGIVEAGRSDIDTALVTGETLPRAVSPGDAVHAGTLNLSGPLQVRATQAAGSSLLSDIVRLMQQAEQRQSRYVRLADRIARYYTPAVHVLATATFLGWLLIGHAPWQQALIVAMTVLIITCPCALGLAVPAVQVVTSSALFRRGLLLKAADALERLARVDLVIFDKTGTLTCGAPRWIADAGIDEATRLEAASLAAHSSHVLARALTRAIDPPLLQAPAREVPGMGVEADVAGVRWRLGRASWCGAAEEDAGAAMELWFGKAGQAPVRLRFADEARADAAATVAALKAQGVGVAMLSGDRASVAHEIGRALGIEHIQAGLLPGDKVRLVEAASAEGRQVLMVGDGLNDAPALAAASASMSPSSGIDITQNAADFVFRGEKLSAVLIALLAARKARRLVRQNLLLSLGYNLCALPLAVSGQVTPLIAALAMSGSSLLVVANALRAGRLEQA